MPGIVLGMGDIALKNIKQGPCPPGNCKSLGEALAAGVLLKVIRNIFLHLSYCSLCIGLIPMGVLFLLADNVVTSVVILIGRESVFPAILAECRRSRWPGLDQVRNSEPGWSSLGYCWGHHKYLCCVHCKEDKQGLKSSAEHTSQSFAWCMTMSAREGPFCNSVRHYSGSGHVLTSEQRWDRVIPTWTKWSEVEERTVGVPLSEDRKRDSGQAKITTSKPWQNEAACSWKHVLYITSSQKFD